MKHYKPDDLFMGFHCRNGSAGILKDPEMKYQLIMKRLLEPDISRGTLEGDIKPSEITLFRLQSTADCQLKAYLAEGEVLDLPTKSFGTIGVIAIDEMARFYRHVLVAGRYPHHAGVAFSRVEKLIFEALKLLGVTDIGVNLPKGVRYPRENPFA